MATFVVVQQYVSRRDNRTPVSKRTVAIVNTEKEEWARYHGINKPDDIKREREQELSESDDLRTQNMSADERLNTPRLLVLDVKRLS